MKTYRFLLVGDLSPTGCVGGVSISFFGLFLGFGQCQLYAGDCQWFLATCLYILYIWGIPLVSLVFGFCWALLALYCNQFQLFLLGCLPHQGMLFCCWLLVPYGISLAAGLLILRPLF